MLGAVPFSDGAVELTVWAPNARSLAGPPADGVHALDRGDDGTFAGRFPGRHGDEYFLAVDEGTLYPGPPSRSHPHRARRGAAGGDAPRVEWTDGDWAPASLDDLVVYELHIGTFTDEGTFDAAVA